MFHIEKDDSMPPPLTKPHMKCTCTQCTSCVRGNIPEAKHACNAFMYFVSSCVNQLVTSELPSILIFLHKRFFVSDPALVSRRLMELCGTRSTCKIRCTCAYNTECISCKCISCANNNISIHILCLDGIS